MVAIPVRVTIPEYLYDRAIQPYVIEGKRKKGMSEIVQELISLGIEVKEKKQAEKLKRTPDATPPDAGVAQPGYSRSGFVFDVYGVVNP